METICIKNVSGVYKVFIFSLKIRQINFLPQYSLQLKCENTLTISGLLLHQPEVVTSFESPSFHWYQLESCLHHIVIGKKCKSHSRYKLRYFYCWLSLQRSFRLCSGYSKFRCSSLEDRQANFGFVQNRRLLWLCKPRYCSLMQWLLSPFQIRKW